MDQDQYLEKASFFAKMSVSDKLNASFNLAKLHAMQMLIVFIVVALIILALISVVFLLGTIMVGPNPTANPGAGAGVFALIILVLLPFILFGSNLLGIGISSLVLRFVEGENVTSVFNLVVMPFRNFIAFIVPIIIWCAISFAANIMFSIIMLIPFIGWLIQLVLSFIFALYNICVTFFLADNTSAKKISATEMLTVAYNILVNDWLNWIITLLVMIAFYIPVGLVLVCLVMAINSASAPVIIFAGLALIVLGIAVNIVVSFFIGITYRQSHARYYIL